MSSYAKSHRRRHEPILDGLPEHTHYVDRGCDVSASCLRCPLPQCRFDDPAWYQAYKREARDREVLAACEDGLSVFEVARQFGISPRTVYRAVQRVGAGEPPAAVQVA